MGRFLLWLSGARPDLIAYAPADQARYQGLGGVLLVTSSLAGLSMFYAMRMAVGMWPWAAVVLALFWSFIVLNLDRWLVISASRTQSRLRTVAIAAPRVVLAVLFGLFTSTPLVLQVFQPEIAAELARQGHPGDTGFLAQLSALTRLSAENQTVNLARFLLFLLLTTVQALPVLVKLLQLFGPASTYDRLLLAQEEAEVTREEVLHRMAEARRAQTANADAFADGLLTMIEKWGPPPRSPEQVSVPRQPTRPGLPSPPETCPCGFDEERDLHE